MNDSPTANPTGPTVDASGSEAPIYAVTTDTALGRLNSRDIGLSAAEAGAAAEKYGPNKLPEAKQKPEIIKFLAHFNDILIYILLVAGIVKAIFQDWVDFWVIIAVAFGNALIGYIQEGQAEKALDGIRGMLSLHATVKRDGSWQDVESESLVPGDVVRFGAGDKIPADIRILDAQRLKIDESMLTGESEPASKTPSEVEPGAGIGDRTNIAHSGTVVTQGSGYGVVYATGRDTEIGHIQAMVDDVDSLKTPLTQQMDKLGTQFAIGIVGVSALLMILGRFVHDMAPEALLTDVLSFAVAAVPEGLPALVTITLALGVQKMARHKAITRKMGAVEALGAVTTICSDKTGTLTRNEMTARVARTPRATYDVTGDGFVKEGELTARASSDEDGLRDLARINALCNDAVLGEGEEAGMWSVIGEPTEAALVIFSHKAGFGAAEAEAYQRTAVIPFDSAYKYMAVRVAGPVVATGEELLMKGAPDVLFARCSSQRDAQGRLVDFDLGYWESEVAALASQGMRVLASARKSVPEHGGLDHADVETGLELVGLVGLIDPPRAEAIEAIKSCHAAGISVKMITGDHVETAKAIGRQLDLRQGQEPVAITGADIEAMSRVDLAERVMGIDVFARTSPEHKIRIVDALQSHDQVVAMTGDGANDAPANPRRRGHRDGDQGHRGHEGSRGHRVGGR